MIEFYAQIKWVHVLAVISSGSLFLLRGLSVQLDRPGIALSAPLRFLSYTVDVVLLTAALMLLSILPGAVFANGWLTVKTRGCRCTRLAATACEYHGRSCRCGSRRS